jgi:two-component system nitrogen regulation sensor histidine kinase GlnL
MNRQAPATEARGAISGKNALTAKPRADAKCDAMPDAQTQLNGLIFALLVIDENNVIANANPAAEDMLGASARRLIGKDLSDAIAIKDERVRTSLANGDERMIARGIDVTARGKDYVINATSSAVTTHPGWRVITLSDAGQDTVQVEDQAELRAPAVLAHEIKNPLSAIRGASQLLSRRISESDKSLTQMITGEADRIAELIDRMQQLGSRPSGNIGPCNLHEAIRNAMATVRAARPDAAFLKEEFDPSLPPVLADQPGLEQVMINLLTNASDASIGLDDAQITVRTRYVSGLRFSALRLGKSTHLPIEIAVIDNGPGIPAELRDHVFEPFVSGKTHGQGLGLALVRKLVRDMGGRIVHDRDPSSMTTTFRINLSVVPKDYGQNDGDDSNVATSGVSA